MDKKIKEKAVRWDIAHAMSCVYKNLNDSELNIKKNKEYTVAIERLEKLYNLNQIQIWLLCFICERFFERKDSTSMLNIANSIDVPVMSIIKWNKERDKLEDLGFIEHSGRNDAVQPVSDFRESLLKNTKFISSGKKDIDEIEFLNHFAVLYENRREEEKTSNEIQSELLEYEAEHQKIQFINRMKTEITEADNRFFLYDVAHDVLSGNDSGLNRTLADLYDGNERFSVARKMMDGTHKLLKNDYLEFITKENLSNATITLSDKGKKLVFGEKAFLFEDSINDKNLIKTDSIKEKRLFYSNENQKEIDRLKNALKEETLKNIQARLKNEGLPVGIAVLLYGAPGTGKTESVMQIAKASGRDIVHVDISEAKSAWFGESEKRIKKIFTSYKNACEIAQKKGELMPILLFNEADALIAKRKDSSAGNCAQTENAIQNIILEELENLKGIFIATTNLACNMDSAFERRFLFKIKFENPSTEAKTAIWMNKLTWLDKNSAIDFAQSYDFSGGQIDNIVRKIALNEVINGERPAISEIHDMCKCEKLENPNGAKRVGFCF